MDVNCCDLAMSSVSQGIYECRLLYVVRYVSKIRVTEAPKKCHHPAL